MATLLHEEITDRIIGAFYRVYNELGYGFLEKVYENALLFEGEGLSGNTTPTSALRIL